MTKISRRKKLINLREAETALAAKPSAVEVTKLTDFHWRLSTSIPCYAEIQFYPSTNSIVDDDTSQTFRNKDFHLAVAYLHAKALKK